MSSLLPSSLMEPKAKTTTSEKHAGHSCAACGAAANLKRCSRCEKAWYCSRACQTSDWRDHKKGCYTKEERKLRKQVAKDTTVKACAVCSKTRITTGKKLLSCAGCMGVRYCSEACQLKDWPAHKEVCGGSAVAKQNKKKKKKQLFDQQQECQKWQVAALRCQKNGDRAGEGRAYCHLGIAYRRLGHFAKAVEFHEKDLAIAREVGDRKGEGVAYGNLGNAYKSLGQFAKAV